MAKRSDNFPSNPTIAKHVKRLRQLKGENARTQYLIPMSAATLVLIGREMGAPVNDNDTYERAGAMILRHLASNAPATRAPAATPKRPKAVPQPAPKAAKPATTSPLSAPSSKKPAASGVTPRTQRAGSIRSRSIPAKSTTPGYIVFQGIELPQGLLGMTHGRKFKTGRAWQLATRKGRPIAQFRTKAMLEKWWDAFQTSQGRIALPLQDGAARQPQSPRPSEKSRMTGMSRTNIGEWRPPTKPSPEDFGKDGQWW
jgi:hypothetical protein